MALISMRQMLDHAAEFGYGVPAFNVNNLEQMRAIMEAADKTDSPVIVQASAGARKYAGAPFLRHLILAAIEEFPHIPVVMHQDHGTSPDVCQRSIQLGFSSVMMDGSLREDGKTPADYDYNVRVTQQTVAFAHACGVSVEGELGCLGSLETGMAGEEDGVGAEGVLDHSQLLTDPEEAADFVKKHDLLAISDEAYDRLLYGDARHRSLAAEPDMRERTLLVGSLSKTYSMTGWRLGYVAGAPELIERLARLQQNYMLSVTSFAQYGGAEALNGPQECVETMRRAFEERRKVLIEGLTGAPNIRFNNPEGAFYLFIDHRDTGLDSVTFCKRLLEEQLVACVPGDDFGPSGEGHIRISYATSTENCAEGARRIRAFLNNL